MTDVARRANVSQATVSYVLNDVKKHTIPEETKRAVWQAAEELDYRPNLAARDLVTGQSSVVVCIVPPLPLSEPVITLLGDLTIAFASQGVVMAVHFEHMGDDSLTAMTKALTPRRTFSLFPAFDDRATDVAGLDSSTDPGSELQVDHLVAAGHRRIGFAGSPEPELRSQSDLREASAARRAEELGLAPIVSRPLPRDVDAAAEVILGWKAAGVTAVCANNDEVALSLLAGARAAGLRIPDDLSVIGYDATAAGASSSPPLTSVGWRVRSLEPLIRSVLQGTPLTTEDVIDPLNVWLVERNSVARPSAD
ncbi:DNA-binding transcriptional regulator, LacI/PurR family [Microbacterium sp. RURRCA19A]|nr:DNA-binding transcriptional regulator, LacI/PurR family [Microbacterium sp. RURRCA19A]